jgi:tight adherence protein B
VQHDTTGISAVLVKIKPLAALQKLLLQSYPDISVAKFVGIAAGVAAGAAMIVFAITGAVPATLVSAALGAYVPFLFVAAKRNRRQKLLADQLPEALEFLSRIMRAGHSLTTGLQMMGSELPEPLASEFRRCYDQHSLGTPLEDALKEMATRSDSTDFAFFITAILIQRQTGGDLSEVLNNISGMIRQRIRLQQSVKAKTAEGRLTGYILVAFPAVMFVLAYMLNPEYGGTLLKSDTGKMLLAVAFGLQMLGLWAIRKITTVKV